MHGGITAKGVDNGNFKHGRYSRFLPPQYEEQFQRLLTDENLLSTVPDIAFNDVVVMGLYSDLLDLDPQVLHLMSQHSKDSLQLLSSDEYDFEEMETQLRRFITYTDMLTQSQKTIQNIQKTQEHRRKLAETESKIKHNASASLPVEQAFAIVTAVMLAVREEVSSPEDIKRVGQRISAIMALPPALDPSQTPNLAELGLIQDELMDDQNP